MHKEELRILLRARPFREFQVFNTDGTSIPIWHPDFAYLSPDGHTLFVYQKDFAFDMLDVRMLPRFAFASDSGSTTNGTSSSPSA